VIDNVYQSHAFTCQGLPIKALWKRDNQSMLILIVFSHFESASVSDGLIGEGANTLKRGSLPYLAGHTAAVAGRGCGGNL